MNLDDIEFDELYVLSDGELYQCISRYDSDPEYAYVRMVQRSNGVSHWTEHLQPSFYRDGVDKYFIRRATDADILYAVDEYFDKIEELNEDVRHYCNLANGLAKKLANRYEA